MAAVPPIPPAEAPSLASMRLPPFSLEAEEAVIGGLLIDNEAWDKVADLVSEENFYKKEHRSLFKVIRKLADKAQPFDAVTLTDKLRDMGEASDDMLHYLASLAEDTPSSANIRAYANIVHEKAIRRKLLEAANQVIEEATKPGEDTDVHALLDRAEQLVFSIADKGVNKRTEFVSLCTAATDTLDHIEALQKAGKDITGLATGFKIFDHQTSGLHQGDLIIVAGRPSMGKTAFTMNIVAHAAISKKQGAVAVFSMEMSARQLLMRMYASLGRINQNAIRKGQVSAEEWKRMVSALQLMRDAEIFIDDTSVLTPFDVHARARRLKREHGSLALVVVDYLQMMKWTALGRRPLAQNRAVEISEISRSLKALARDLEVPVIAVSQLNRDAEKRDDKRPGMADLRDSGSIEQDADLIAFVYRDEVYDKETKDQGLAEIIVAKQRNGPQFKTKLTFRGEYYLFENYVSPDEYSSVPRTYRDHSLQEDVI